jgi:hypothetical protein
MFAASAAHASTNSFRCFTGDVSFQGKAYLLTRHCHPCLWSEVLPRYRSRQTDLTPMFVVRTRTETLRFSRDDLQVPY